MAITGIGGDKKLTYSDGTDTVEFKYSAEITAKTGVSKKDAEAVIVATLDTITAALKEGEKVQLVGFGSFEVKKRAARIGRNPKTKESIEIPASKLPAFKASKALKDIIAK
mgnify:CR=1 FL=1